jgi:DNA-directed RNA polymerase subunit delta
MSEVDVAYHILKQAGQPVYFRELIEEVLRIKPVGSENWSRTAAAIYTQLNLDTRFSYQGKGKWGLRSVVPGKKLPRRIKLIGKGADGLYSGRGRRLRLLVRRGDGLGLGESPEIRGNNESSEE